MKQKRLLALCAGIAVPLLITGCAKPGGGTDHAFASNAIREAQVAGAETYAAREYGIATASFHKAEKLLDHKRTNRAQKLLELATAQADLAKTISEAEHAEASLRQVQHAETEQ